jgi:hypothetical protein
MNAHHQLCLAFGLFALCSQAVHAQLSPPAIQPVESGIQFVTIFGNLAQTDVTGAPYSTIEKPMYSQEQPDGTYQDRTLTVTHMYRDSYGRTRAERSVTSYHFGTSETHLLSIFITDPLTDSLYRLDPENRTATRRSWKAFIQEASADAASTSGCFARTPEPQLPVITDSLGSRTLEGLVVEGTRQTMTVPADTVGNTRQIDIMIETWISPELHVAVLRTRNDSITGRDTTRLTQIDRSEPAAELFQVPSDYDVENEPDATGSGCGPVLP